MQGKHDPVIRTGDTAVQIWQETLAKNYVQKLTIKTVNYQCKDMVDED